LRETCASATQRRTHLGDHDVRAAVNVRRCKAEESISGVDERVLPAIVLDQTLPMVASVVFKNKPRLRVVQISPANEPSRTIAKIRLDFWSRQTGLDQQPAKSSFHRRLSWSRQRRKQTHPSHAGTASRALGVFTQSNRIRKASPERHVDRNQCLDGRLLKAQSREGERKGNNTKASHPHHLTWRNFAMTHGETCPRADPG